MEFYWSAVLLVWLYFPLVTLAQVLFPLTSVSPAVICEPGKNDWRTAVTRRIFSIRDANRRKEAMDLFMRIDREILVRRPWQETSLGDSESVWVKAARTLHEDVPLDAVVTDENYDDTLSLPVKQINDPAFWQKYRNPRLVGRNLESQNAALRTVCLHSDWLLVRMPYLKGSVDDEIVTVKQIIQLASSLKTDPAGGLVTVQLDNRHANSDRFFRNVASELKNVRQHSGRIKVELRDEKILNRELLGGEFAPRGEGKEPFHRARWFMQMTHVAIGGGGAHTDDNSWNLFDRRAASNRLEQIQRIEVVDSCEIT